jgi:drug/metabolite transporter (DMT)-like permease
VTDLGGLLLGLCAAFAWGSTDVVATVTSRRIGSLRTTAATQLTSVAIILTLFLTTGARLPGDPAVAAVALACGLVSGIAYLAFFTALRLGPLSVVSPVTSVYGGLTVVLSLLLLGERLDPAQAVGVATATGGVLLASVVVDVGARRPRFVGPGVAYALVALVSFAFLVIALSGPIRAAGWQPILLLSRLANATFTWTVLGLRTARRRTAARPIAVSRRSSPTGGLEPAPGGGGDPPRPIAAIGAAAADPASIDPGSVGAVSADVTGAPGRAGFDARSVGLAMLVGVLDIGGFIVFAIGLQVAPTWLVGLASSLGPVVAVAAGVAVFGERPRPIQWAGLGLVLASVFLIALGG